MNSTDLTNKSLLLVTSWFPCKGSSTSSPFIFSQVNEIKKFFRNVEVISLNPFVPQYFQNPKFKKIFDTVGLNERWHNDIFSGHYCRDYEYDNVKVHFASYVSLPVFSQWKKSGEAMLKTAQDIIQKKNIEFDLIHAQRVWPAGYVGANLSNIFDCPLVITAHGGDIYTWPFIDASHQQQAKFILDSANHVITVGSGNIKCIEAINTKAPVSLIPNGFDDSLFFLRDKIECRKKLGLPLNKQILLTVGNLIEIKGHRYLIEAIPELIKHRKDILLVIIGDGPIRSDLQHQIRSLGLEEHVVLTGGKTHKEIPIWMNAADIFILPSLKESFGVVQIEAMACGKPVVATKNGGSDDIVISDDYGYLVEPSNPSDLAGKILMALDREWNQQTILQHASQYTWKNIAENICDILIMAQIS